MVWIAGASFLMGSDHHYREEKPAHRVTVDGFWIDRHEVTNAEFARFVAATRYVTLAERTPNPADYPGAKPDVLVPGSVVFQQPDYHTNLNNPYLWWRYVRGAHWRQPYGPDTTIIGLGDHPVVHIAYEDAVAYAQWAGKLLPTEAEWEFAARGGLDGAEYAWGSELTPGGRQMANTWQGTFPYDNAAIDGYERTSPVGSFPPNGYGLFDMIGNVWEWTQDWYEGHEKYNACCSNERPRGGAREDVTEQRTAELRIPRKVIKGGSYLSAPNHDRRYRPAARLAQPVDTSTCHLGFRCIVRQPR
jgi:formylglycine-generating enzyme required for sulfatase activity